MYHVVAHYTPLKERKEHMIKQFDKKEITNYSFMEEHDREVLTKEQLDKFSIINSSEISLFYKHIEILKQQQDLPGVTLVYEDDAVLIDSFSKNLDRCLRDLPEDWDIVFAGECFGIHYDYWHYDTLLYPKNESRGTCFYILNNECAKKIVDFFENSSSEYLPIDHWFNKAIRENGLKCFWTEPTLVWQGSEMGLFKKEIKKTE
jgi:GR25 family glycosyltransferase involved in LPS biosynthesis